MLIQKQFNGLFAGLAVMAATAAWAQPGRLVKIQPGVVRDNATGLEWANRDNGSDIDANAARQWCAGLPTAGGGWRLPSSDELTAIANGSSGSTTCMGSSCGLPGVFAISGNFAWTADASPMGARRVNLVTGQSGQALPSEMTYSRAMCVRTAASAAPPPATDNGARWAPIGTDVLQDNASGLQWTRSDNGANVVRAAARGWCNTLGVAGGGWRLPEMAELQRLVADGSGDSNRCGNLVPCRVSPLFQISEYRFWSATPAAAQFGKPMGYIVDLTNGKSSPWTPTFTNRALCVRSAR